MMPVTLWLYSGGELQRPLWWSCIFNINLERFQVIKIWCPTGTRGPIAPYVLRSKRRRRGFKASRPDLRIK